jgi:hypothetical protein
MIPDELFRHFVESRSFHARFNKPGNFTMRFSQNPGAFLDDFNFFGRL